MTCAKSWQTPFRAASASSMGESTRVLLGTYSKSVWTAAMTCRTVVSGSCARSAAGPSPRA